MDEKGFQQLRERLQTANGLRSRIKKCEQSVKEYTHLHGNSLYGSTREEHLKKKLDYWIAQMELARKRFAAF